MQSRMSKGNCDLVRGYTYAFTKLEEERTTELGDTERVFMYVLSFRGRSSIRQQIAKSE